MPSSGCTLTRPRAGAQTGRNKNNPRLPEIGGYIFAVNLYKLYMKGRSKNSKGAHPKSRKFKGEKRRNESIKARSTPFRSPPIIPQCFSKNHSKTRESKIFSKTLGYIEEEETQLKITCAGLPKNCYKNVSWENFSPSAKYSGKLIPKRVKNGVILEETLFTIKD